VLGPDFEQRDLPLPEGAIATLVRRRHAGPAGTRAASAVLYVHGFVDYFFQTHLADAFEARGYRFYAVDLRGCGRSIGRGAVDGPPNFVRDLAVYAKDLDAAVAAIRAEGHRGLVLNAHSTGGLIGPLWADARPGWLTAMALNSPWLELNENWLMRGPVSAGVGVIGRFAPKLKVAGLWPYYGEALHRETGGEWDYDLAWKPHRGFPVAAGWFRSVRRAHHRVARGLNVTCPVLVLTSARRGPHRHCHPELLTSDSILNPAHMWERAPRLGPNVEVRVIPGGAHDLSLSPEPGRSAYLGALLEWLDAAIDRSGSAVSGPGASAPSPSTGPAPAATPGTGPDPAPSPSTEPARSDPRSPE
jgi:alpha-beta hydrolase superfamily lysophospholipase